MALDQAAATAAATTYIDQVAPNIEARIRPACIESMATIFKVIFDAIVANAVVLPSGSPAMTADGDPVVGQGRVT